MQLIKLEFKFKKIYLKKKEYNFKHFRKSLLSRTCNLKTDEQKDELFYILINYFENLRIAYRKKEDLLDILHSEESFDIKIICFNNWINSNLNSDIAKIREVTKTYHHWYIEIRNFKYLKARILLLNR